MPFAPQRSRPRRTRTETACSDDGVHLPAWFEVTRIRILVGNPNVKVLGATITKSAPPSSDAE